MPKFEKLEDAQKWVDEHEPKLAEVDKLSKQVATLNRENAERRQANEKLEKDLLDLRDSGKSAARKEAEASVKAEYEGKLKEAEGKSSAEMRRLRLERAALAAGVKPDKLDYAVRLLPPDVDLEKAGDAVGTLLKDFPVLAAVPGSSEAVPPGGKGGAPKTDLSEKIAKGQAVELGELTKGTT